VPERMRRVWRGWKLVGGIRVELGRVGQGVRSGY
jgi:hypothetical protein